ncbi:hypothetical protein LAZ67_21002185 [Cordylochernes scorpioides]|uniref:Uncharacterized protein n=1 Tax=Cordylochernes scorpioides TaxID=51811 RepID=A0ABY6LMR1_9ARAC|nr:hypothetical protein LAZ67_21002185 [Cordylochernes scorpioides]
MLEMTRTDPEWKDKIITGDETWVYGYDPETKRQSAEWRGQDIAPNDFFLFPKLKAVLKGRHFDTREDIIEKSLLALKSIPKEAYKNCFDNWEKRWRCHRPPLSRMAGALLLDGYDHVSSLARFIISRPLVVVVSCPWSRSDRSVHPDHNTSQLRCGVLSMEQIDRSVHPDHNTGQLRCLVRMDVLFWIDICHIEGCKDGRVYTSHNVLYLGCVKLLFWVNVNFLQACKAIVHVVQAMIIMLCRLPPRLHGRVDIESRQDSGRQGTSKQVDHCLYRKMEQGREEESKEPMKTDPDYESGDNPTFPKKETTLDVLGRLTTTRHQLSAVTGHRERWNRYDGSYEAQSFFTNYDAQADRAQLQYSTRLRKPANLLQAPLRVTNTRAYVTCSPDHL